MITRSASFVLFTFFVLSNGSIFSQSQASRDELTSLFKAAVAAVGDQKAIANTKSIAATANCVGPKGKYTTSISSFRDNKTSFEQIFSYRDKPSKLFINGDIAWEKQFESDQFSVVSQFQRMVARSHEYQKMAFDFQRFFVDFELVGDDMFEGRRSTKVRAKNELGITANLYFDKETKRFSGYVLEIPNSTETVKNVFLEWRQIGKLLLPSVVRATDRQGEWTLTFHTIRLNTADSKLLDVPPRITDMTELLKLHEQQKTAHLTNNAELFIEMFAEDLTQLQRGTATVRTKTENLARFKSYFGSFKFQDWEDIVPPVIKISKDGTMATKIVQKRVRGTYKNEKGEDESDHTIFAWLEVWEKIDGKWKVTTVASTDKPGQK